MEPTYDIETYLTNFLRGLSESDLAHRVVEVTCALTDATKGDGAQ